jgi:hypothetical protein
MSKIVAEHWQCALDRLTCHALGTSPSGWPCSPFTAGSMAAKCVLAAVSKRCAEVASNCIAIASAGLSAAAGKQLQIKLVVVRCLVRDIVDGVSC